MAKFTVGAGEGGTRADVFIATQYPQFSRSAMTQLFNKGMVTLGSKVVKASYKVQEGDELLVDETYLSATPPLVELPIIYEDKDVIVINKPEGMLTHAKGALNLEASVASFISNRLADSELSGNRAGIVHRLDRGTSGVIITAKTKSAQSWLQKQFSKRNAKKTYLAIVHGAPEPSEAIIDAPIMRDPAHPQTFRVGKQGKNALTQYKILKTGKKGGHSFSLVELKPMTGRTHQLRVHMAYIKHPIVGDDVYGPGSGQLMLHAQSLELTLPSSERHKFTIPTPLRIKKFFDE